MFEITVKGDIASGHQLHGYDGNCKNLHGHTWKVEAVVVGDQLDRVGMLADFRELKKKLKMVLAPIDHVHLNDLPAFKDINPTTENIARYVYREFAKACGPLKLKHVQVWESESAGVLYYE